MEPRGSIESPPVQADTGQVAATGMQTARGLRPPVNVPPGGFSGDVFTVTVGEEKFFPVKFQGFTVGPVAYTTALGPGEDAASAYARASAVAHAMFEAEFQMKRVDYWRRLGQVEPK